MSAYMSAASASITSNTNIMGVLAAATWDNSNSVLPRLLEWGFTTDDIHRAADRGCAPEELYASVERLINSGIVDERTVRDEYIEANSFLFGDAEPMEITEPSAPAIRYGKDDRAKNEISNYVAIMRSDEAYRGIKFNEMSGRAEIHTIDHGTLKIEPWTDADEAQSMMHIEQTYGIYSKDKHAAALRILFQERAYNPIVEIVDGIKWDGEPRCRHFLHEWAKVEDSPYTQEVSRLIFAGGIHRLYQPGTKFDDVPILIGTKQGEGKSSLIRFLAINDQYYGEVTLMDGQQAIEQLRGKWICEISELLALTKSKEQEAAKAYITRQVDSYRKPWDKNVSDLPRRCVMIGSTNSDAFLSDKTGNRRYYPVEVHCNGYDLFDHEQECRDYILQAWAEARELYRAGKMPNFADRSLVKEYRKAQEDAMQDDWRVGAIIDFLDRKLPGELTCVREVCHRALSTNPDMPREPTLVESKDIGAIITRLPHWKKVGKKRMANYGSQRCWQKDDDAPLPVPDDPFEGV